MEWASSISQHAWSKPVEVGKIIELEVGEWRNLGEEDEVDCWGKSRPSSCSRHANYFKLKPC